MEKHYAEHEGKPFFPIICGAIADKPVVAMVWEGDNVIATGRKIIGATNPSNAEPGTLRGNNSIFTSKNSIHGSDGVDSARREIALWFKSEELQKSKDHSDSWVYKEQAPKEDFMTSTALAEPALNNQKTTAANAPHNLNEGTDKSQLSSSTVTMANVAPGSKSQLTRNGTELQKTDPLITPEGDAQNKADDKNVSDKKETDGEKKEGSGMMMPMLALATVVVGGLAAFKFY